MRLVVPNQASFATQCVLGRKYTLFRLPESRAALCHNPLWKGHTVSDIFLSTFFHPPTTRSELLAQASDGECRCTQGIARNNIPSARAVSLSLPQKAKDLEMR